MDKSINFKKRVIIPALIGAAGTIIATVIMWIFTHFGEMNENYFKYLNINVFDWLQAKYLSFSILMRFNVFIWGMAFFVYYILERYDERLGIEKKRTVKKVTLQNYYFLVYAAVSLAGLMSHSNDFGLVTSNNILNTTHFVLGIILTIIGFLILVIGRVDIDGLWGPDIYEYHDPESDELVQSGLYSKMRHPIYLGQIILAFSTFFVSFSIYFLFFFIFVLWVDGNRARVEEKYLCIRFGDDYKRYKAKVKKWYLC